MNRKKVYDSSSDDESDRLSEKGSSRNLAGRSIPDDEIFHGPLPKQRFGILKAMVIIVAGVYSGAWFAAVGANMLEELEIFVRDDDDED